MADEGFRSPVTAAAATLGFDKSEPTPIPKFVSRANAADQSRIQADIARLAKRLESGAVAEREEKE
jgi:hypothetical protein